MEMGTVRGMSIFEAEADGASSDGAIFQVMMWSSFLAMVTDVQGAAPLNVALLLAKETAIVDVLLTQCVWQWGWASAATCRCRLWFFDGAASGGVEGSSDDASSLRGSRVDG